MSDHVGAKAITLATTGQVAEDPAARVFRVKTYTVVVSGIAADLCTCQAGQRGVRCSHVAAARLMLAEQRKTETVS